MTRLVTDRAQLRALILEAMAQGATTWPEINARAGGHLDLIAAGLLLTELEAEGVVRRDRSAGSLWSVYHLTADMGMKVSDAIS